MNLHVEEIGYVLRILLQAPGPYRLNISARVGDGDAAAGGCLGYTSSVVCGLKEPITNNVATSFVGV